MDDASSGISVLMFALSASKRLINYIKIIQELY